MAPETYALRLRQAGTSTVLAQTSATLAAGDDLTLLLAGAPGGLHAWAVADDNAHNRSDEAYLRVTHAATIPRPIDRAGTRSRILPRYRLRHGLRL